MLAGTVTVGGVVSRTVTVKLPAAGLPAASDEEHETVVTPSGNVTPEAGVHVTAGLAGSVSVAVATYVTTAPDGPVASAVMAAGTVGQFLFRRAVSTLLNGGRSWRTGANQVRRRGDDGMVDEAQIITETVMMRRVRVRRQA